MKDAQTAEHGIFLARTTGDLGTSPLKRRQMNSSDATRQRAACLRRALIAFCLLVAETFTTNLATASEPDPPAEPAAPALPADKKLTGVVPAVPNPSPSVLAGEPSPELETIPPLIWNHPRFSTADYFITGTGGALTLTAAIVAPRSVHSISGGILFDDAARRALRAHSLQARYQFRDASDVGLSLSVTWPFFADALASAWWYRGSRDAAEQIALIDLETLAIAGAVQGATNVIVSRERPYGQDCGSSQLPGNAIDCQSSQQYRSFFSGHATFSFTGAALICMHHFENDLLGSPWDALSCAGGYAVAATTSTFRIVSDVHYASDVILGALVGTAIGYGVPLLHYRQTRASTAANDQLRLMLVPSPGGASVMGVF
jgi:membrane-associated phospholipid phosphatase